MRIALRSISTAAVLLAALALQACGGGGGGGDVSAPGATGGGATGGGSSVDGATGGAVTTVPAGNSTTTTTATQTVVVTGVANYESVPYRTISAPGVSAGSLDYNATVRKPVRGATIQAVKNSGLASEEILASTSTSDTGSYALNVPINTQYALRLRAEMLKTSGAAQWNVSVLDNTLNNALWAVETGPGATTTTNAIRSITAATTWDGTKYTQNTRPAGIFTMLDTLYTSMQQIVAAQPAVIFPKLTVHWSPNNTDTAATANLATGQLGGKTFFRSASTTTFVAGVATTVNERQIYVLGKADVDSDEFDRGIMAHEFGHYLQNVFSVANVSLGGGHGLGNRLDMTLAFSEGWGNAYSSIARNDPIYADAGGVGQASGFTINFGNTAAITNKGWFNEVSVANSIYLLFNNAGFAPVWNALTGPMRTQASLPTIFSFAAAVRGASVPAATTALNNVLAANLISTTSDEWGNNETNNGGAASNLPVYSPLAFNTATSTCYNTVNMTDPTDINKLGMVKYHRHTLAAANAGTRTVRANFEANRDVDFDVFQNNVRLVRAANITAAGGTFESRTVPLAAGDVVIRTRDFKTDIAPTTCATLVLN